MSISSVMYYFVYHLTQGLPIESRDLLDRQTRIQASPAHSELRVLLDKSIKLLPATCQVYADDPDLTKYLLRDRDYTQCSP